MKFEIQKNFRKIIEIHQKEQSKPTFINKEIPFKKILKEKPCEEGYRIFWITPDLPIDPPPNEILQWQIVAEDYLPPKSKVAVLTFSSMVYSAVMKVLIGLKTIEVRPFMNSDLARQWLCEGCDKIDTCYPE